MQTKSQRHPVSSTILIYLLCFVTVSLLPTVVSVHYNPFCLRGKTFDECIQHKRLSLPFTVVKESSNKQLEKIDVPVYGNLHDYAYYYTVIDIGTPIQKQAVVVDTGSPNLVVDSSLCCQCGHHELGSFNPKLSQTLTNVDAKSPYCMQSNGDLCKQGTCCFEQSYEEDSIVTGYYVEDHINFEAESKVNVMYRLGYIGLITRETNLIYKQKAGGVMGLGLAAPSTSRGPSHQELGSTASFSSYEQASSTQVKEEKTHDTNNSIECIQDITRDQNCDRAEYTNLSPKPFISFIRDYLEWHFNPDMHIFSLCLSENGGSLTFGGFHKEMAKCKKTVDNRSLLSRSMDPIQWIPMVRGEGYVLQVEAISIMGILLEIKNTSFILDSGSTNTLLELPVHSVFNDFYRDLCEMIKEPDISRWNEDETAVPKFSLLPKQRVTYSARRNVIKAVISRQDKEELDHINEDENRREPLNPQHYRMKKVITSVGANTRVTTNDKRRYHSLLKVYRRLNPGVKCNISSKTGYICFSDILHMPDIMLHLRRGGFIRWRPGSYFIRRRMKDSTTLDKGWWCLGIDNGENENVLGATFFKNNLLIFDLKAGKLGYSEARCPERKR